MKVSASGVAIVLVLAGCAKMPTTSLPTGEQSTLRGKTLVSSSRERPDFLAMTAGKAGFGLLGAAAMVSAGNKIVADNNVDDPAVYLSRELGTALAAAQGVQVISLAGTKTVETDVAKLAAAYKGQGDVLLDVQTYSWGFGYFPSDWNNYRVMYTVIVRVIDTRAGKLMAQGSCSRAPEKTDDAPTHDELLANSAERLKKELRAQADSCLSELKTKVLNI